MSDKTALCPFCKKLPGTKVGPPAMARCITPDCEGRNLGAVTLAEWNAAAPQGFTEPTGLRQQLADQVGYYFAALISGNNQPHMSGDPRARLHGERRRRFDETCLEVVDTISAALRSGDIAQAAPVPCEAAKLADELDRLRQVEADTPDGEPDNMGETWHDYADCFMTHHAEITAALRGAAATHPSQYGSMGEAVDWQDIHGNAVKVADAIKAYFDDGPPADGRHSDKAHGNAYELLQWAEEELRFVADRLAAAPQPPANAYTAKQSVVSEGDLIEFFNVHCEENTIGLVQLLMSNFLIVASPVSSTQNSPPVELVPQNSAERIPSSDAGSAGGEAVSSTNDRSAT